MKVKMVKTTLAISEELWRDFSIEVIRQHGGRKKNDVIQQLIQDWVNTQKQKEKTS